MFTLLRELRQAARRMARSPALAAAAILCTALGVGAVSAAWSAVDAVLLRPLPYDDPDNLVVIWERAIDGSAERVVVSPANFGDWRERARTFERMAAFNVWFPGLTGVESPEKLLGAMVSADFFPVLGAQPLLGRTFLPEDDRPGAAPVVVLSHGLWRRRFGGDRGILGRAIELDGVPHTVVGVMPAGFRHPEPLYLDESTALWKPLALAGAESMRAQRFLRVVARVNVPLHSALAEMDGVAQQLAREHPAENEGMGVEVVALRDQLVGDARRPLLLLLAAAALVLLVACANVASLLLAAAAGRARETALRAALGAGRRDLARQALAESLPPVLLGGALGSLLGIWGARLLLAAAPPLARPAELGLEPRSLALALAACLGVAYLAGLTPALQDAGALHEGGARTVGPGGPRGARALALLVALEVALSLPLLTGAGLLGRSLARLTNTPLGFEDEGVVTLRLEPPPARYAAGVELGAFYERLLARVAAVPGVRAAGLTSSLPLSGLYDINLNVSLEDGERPVEAGYRGVSPGYFAALGIPLRSGRLPGPGDGPESAKVALVNEAFARAAWPGRQPVGRAILLQGAAGTVTREVIGVVGDVRHAGPAEEPRPEIYVPYSQSPLRFATLTARADGEPEAVLAAVRSAVWEVDRDLALAGAQPLARTVAAATARPRFHRLLAGVLAAVAVALAAAGLFGVTAWSVARRTREIGVRMALGADRGRVVRGMLRGALAPVLAGLLLGLAASLALTRLLTGLLHDVAPTDPVTLVAAPLLLLLIALAAATLPARRAARTDPAAGLRAE